MKIFTAHLGGTLSQGKKLTISCLQKHGDTPGWDWMGTPLTTGTWTSLQIHTADIFSLTQVSKLLLQVNHWEASLIMSKWKIMSRKHRFSKKVEATQYPCGLGLPHTMGTGGQNPGSQDRTYLGKIIKTEKSEQNQRKKASKSNTYKPSA